MHTGQKSCLRKHLPRGLNGFSLVHAVVSSSKTLKGSKCFDTTSTECLINRYTVQEYRRKWRTSSFSPIYSIYSVLRFLHTSLSSNYSKFAFFSDSIINAIPCPTFVLSPLQSVSFLHGCFLTFLYQFFNINVPTSTCHLTTSLRHTLWSKWKG